MVATKTARPDASASLLLELQNMRLAGSCGSGEGVGEGLVPGIITITLRSLMVN